MTHGTIERQRGRAPRHARLDGDHEGRLAAGHDLRSLAERIDAPELEALGADVVPGGRQALHEGAEEPPREDPLDVGERALGDGVAGAAQQALDDLEHEDELGRHDHLRLAAGGLDDRGDRRLGHRVQRVGEGELAGVDDLELDVEAMLGAQPRGGRGAEDLHDAAQAALLVDAELARTAEVDRAQPARAPALAVVGGSRPGAGRCWPDRTGRRSRRRRGSRSSQGHLLGARPRGRSRFRWRRGRGPCGPRSRRSRSP